jgi:hypothetical protein
MGRTINWKSRVCSFDRWKRTILYCDKKFRRNSSATNVVAMSINGNEMPSSTRNIHIMSSDDSSKFDNFTLGPLLPNMEKHYWLSLDSALLQKVKDDNSQFFTMVYFSYEFSGGKAGYGMLSQFDAKTGTFLHKDMWVD